MNALLASMITSSGSTVAARPARARKRQAALPQTRGEDRQDHEVRQQAYDDEHRERHGAAGYKPKVTV
ncbi:hypothetical protein [Dactylosporangium sp. CA-233914]|uniref:hypothetical protein n=1 Tax=Dactylosporangium sp. CA-233914 TaxID=3239934 RepID=UPI003D94F68B